MVRFFWLLFWSNIILLMVVTSGILALIWVVFFSKRTLTDSEIKELQEILKRKGDK